MRAHTVVVLITIAMLAVSSSAMAKGGSGGGGGGRAGSAVGHGHFGGHFQNTRHFQNFQRFPRNQVFLGGGWGWDWGYPGNGGNTSVLVSQQNVPAFPAADITGSVMAPPCHWNEETFNVPSSAGGKRPVQVVSCR
jgi:hypothetical protein